MTRFKTVNTAVLTISESVFLFFRKTSKTSELRDTSDELKLSRNVSELRFRSEKGFLIEYITHMRLDYE